MAKIDYMALASCLSGKDVQDMDIMPNTAIGEVLETAIKADVSDIDLGQCDNDTQIYDAYGQYVKSLPNLPLLTKEQEIELSARIAKGDMKARNELIEHNLRFVINIATHYTGRGLDIMDLIQEGNVGLTIASERFDGTKGFRFTTYAVFWITYRICTALRNRNGGITIPPYISTKVKTVLMARNSFFDKYNREPTEEELCEITGFSQRVLRNLLELPNCTISLDKSSSGVDDDENATIGNLICDDAPSPEVTAEAEHLKEVLEQHMACLSDKERLIINMYFGLNNSPVYNGAQIGQILGLHRERIRQIKNGALRKMAVHKKDLKDFLED